MVMTAAFEATLKSQNPLIANVMRVTIAGVDYRWSSHPYASTVTGATRFYEPRVLRWGSIRRATSGNSGTLQFTSFDVEIDDTDKTFHKLLETVGEAGIRNSPMTCWSELPGNPQFNWQHLHFTGRLVDWKMSGRHSWTLSFRFFDSQLLETFAQKVPLTINDFPYLPPQTQGSYAPILYGTHNSALWGGFGALRCLKIENYWNYGYGYTYLVALNWIKGSITRAFREKPKTITVVSSSVAAASVITTIEPHELTTGDSVTIVDHVGSTPALAGPYVVTVTGAKTFTIPVNVTVAGTKGTFQVFQITGTLYTFKYTINGRKYTVVGQGVDHGDAILVDATGYDSDGTGTGTLITTSAKQMEHFLNNYVFETTGRLSAAHFTALEAYENSFGVTGGRKLEESKPIRCVDVLNQWLRGYGYFAWWNPDGTIAVGVEDHRTGVVPAVPDDVYLASKPWLHLNAWEADEIGDSFRIEYDREVYDRVHVRTAYDSASGEYQYPIEARDPLHFEGNTDSIDNIWHSDYGSAAPTSRLIASRRLYHKRFPRLCARMTVPLWAAGFDLLDTIAIPHPLWPSEDGNGATPEVWKRGYGILHEISVNLNDMTCEILVKDRRPILSSLRESLLLTKTPAGAGADSNAQLVIGAGAAHTFNRASVGWYTDPGTGLFISNLINGIRYDANGLLIEGFRTNRLARSSFKSGLLGWAATGSGTVVADATKAFFHTAESPSVAHISILASPDWIIFTAPTTPTPFVANEIVTLSIDKEDNAVTAAAALHYRLYRTIDNFHYNDLTGTWALAAINNPTLMGRNRYISKPINVGAAGTNLVLQLVMQANQGIRQAWVGHCQIEVGRWASSRILTEAVEVTRAAEQFFIANNAGARAWPITRGRAFMRIVPFWNSADENVSGAGAHVLMLVYHDNNNYIQVAYQPWAGSSTGVWRFIRVAGGVAVYAYLAQAVVRDVPQYVGVRWTSSLAEWGAPASKIAIWANGVKGDELAAPTAFTEQATSALWVGSGTAGSHVDAAISFIDIAPVVPSDAEMARWRG